MRKLHIFYCHGMGGGMDSRIPSVLAQHYAGRRFMRGGEECEVEVVWRMYDFDPSVASAQMREWEEEFKPDMVIGESMGANHAISMQCGVGVPHLYVSPAVNAPKFFGRYAWTCWIPGVSLALKWTFRPKRPNRQKMRFRPWVLKKYKALHKKALGNAGKDYSFAFFGTNDHYLKWGVVDIKAWDGAFGRYAMYPGSHFMEQEFLDSMLIPKINEVLGLEEL